MAPINQRGVALAALFLAVVATAYRVPHRKWKSGDVGEEEEDAKAVGSESVGAGEVLGAVMKEGDSRMKGRKIGQRRNAFDLGVQYGSEKQKKQDTPSPPDVPDLDLKLPDTKLSLLNNKAKALKLETKLDVKKKKVAPPPRPKTKLYTRRQLAQFALLPAPPKRNVPPENKNE